MYLPLAVFCILSLASASDVLEFTDGNFADEVAKHDMILVEFYAPWCGHCKRLAPEYEVAATELQKNDPPVPLAKVDCIANSEVCGKYGVSGYPTLKIFKGGEMSADYDGPRESAGIVKYMKKRAGPDSKELTTVEDAEKFLKSEDYGVIGFFSSATSDIAKTFQKVASGLSEDLRFAHTSDEKVNEKYGQKDAIVLYQPKRFNSKFEEPQQKYNDDLTVYKIKSWLAQQSLGLCGYRRPDNAELFDKHKKPLVVAYYEVDYKKNVKGTNYWRNRVMKVAKKFQEAGKTVHFAISSIADFGGELTEFGADASKAAEKPIVAAKNDKSQKFVMADEFSMDNLEKFVNDFLDNKLEPFMKSEPVPDNSGNAVKVAVAKNFDEVVADDKDVLVEFYAPWCGHCKNLEPKYNELAEKLESEPEIVIAKMDATANDVPPAYQVQGFPTIYFKPKGSSPKKYEGGREVDDFVKYLAKQSTSEMEGFNRDGKKKKGKKGKKTEL